MVQDEADKIAVDCFDLSLVNEFLYKIKDLVLIMPIKKTFQEGGHGITSTSKQAWINKNVIKYYLKSKFK